MHARATIKIPVWNFGFISSSSTTIEMVWPFSKSSPKTGDDPPTDILTTVTNVAPYAAVLLLGATGSLVSLRVYKTYLRRIPTAERIPSNFLRSRTIFGRVTSVGDGDNFHVFHTPGGRFSGWGWARKVPSTRQELSGKTIHVRLAGVDAPECAHFGKPAQPYSGEALQFLTDFVLGRRVRVSVWRKDQYGRVVGTAHVRRGLFRRDVSLAMLKTGMATIYEAKFGSEFGGKEKEYRKAEEVAKNGKVGLWKEDRNFLQRLMGVKSEEKETPREYKTRMSQAEGKGSQKSSTSATSK